MKKLSLEEKKIRKKKISAIVWAVIYLVVAFCICATSCTFFVRNYYRPIYISGGSMYPTLLGGQYHPGVNNFGYCDNHKSMLDKIERFDIITTYFPWASEGDYDQGYSKDKDNVLLESASFKIKRVIAMPGETFKICDNQLFVKDTKTNKYPTEISKETGMEVEVPTKLPFTPFITSVTKPVNVSERTLAEDEYWVMGDNWQGSKDCVDYNAPIYKENLVGVLIVILGTCHVIQTGNNIEQITKKHYKWPVFYK